MLNRRNFLRGLIAAPAVVQFASLMPVRGIIMDASIIPASTDIVALGGLSLQWSDLFLVAGSVITWKDGDVTITHPHYS